MLKIIPFAHTRQEICNMVSIMKCNDDLFHIRTFTVHRTISVYHDFSSSKASDPMFCQFYQN